MQFPLLACPFPPITLVADQIGEEAGSEESSVKSQYLRRGCVKSWRKICWGW